MGALEKLVSSEQVPLTASTRGTYIEANSEITRYTDRVQSQAIIKP